MLLDAKIAAVKPLADSDDEARLELTNLLATRRDKCEKITLMKSPVEQVRIITEALKTHTDNLEKVEQEHRTWADKGDALEAKVRDCRFLVEEAKLDKIAAESRAAPPQQPHIQIDEDTIALLAGLRQTLTHSRQTVAWAACDNAQVEALKLVLTMASDHAEKKKASSSGAPLPAAGQDVVTIDLASADLGNEEQPPCQIDACSWNHAKR